MNQPVKKVKQVCKCENCGNEAEMVVTCTLEEEDEVKAGAQEKKPIRVKGTGTCSHCGNEADMWVDV
jgi:ribosomal protein L34E